MPNYSPLPWVAPINTLTSNVRECLFPPRLGYSLCILVLIGETWNLSDVFICVEHFSCTSDICISFPALYHLRSEVCSPFFPGRSPFYLDKGARGVKGKIVTGIAPVWPGTLPLENCSPRPSHSWSVSMPEVQCECARGLLAVLDPGLPGGVSLCHGSESPASCSPDEFLGGESARHQDCSLQLEHFHHPSLCSPCQLLASLLLPNLPGLNHSAALFSMPSGPVDISADCQAAEFPDDLVLSLSFPRWEVERGPRPLPLWGGAPFLTAVTLPSCLAAFALGLIYWLLVPRSHH